MKENPIAQRVNELGYRNNVSETAFHESRPYPPQENPLTKAHLVCGSHHGKWSILPVTGNLIGIDDHGNEKPRLSFESRGGGGATKNRTWDLILIRDAL
jgi:hypothetical protein